MHLELSFLAFLEPTYVLLKNYVYTYIYIYRLLFFCTPMVACGSGHTATFGMTKFADWTDAEFRARLLSGLDGRPSLSKRTPADAGVGGGASTTSGLCKFSGAKGTPRFPYNCTYVQDASFVNSSVPKEWDWRDVDGV